MCTKFQVDILIRLVVKNKNLENQNLCQMTPVTRKKRQLNFTLSKQIWCIETRNVSKISTACSHFSNQSRAFLWFSPF